MKTTLTDLGAAPAAGPHLPKSAPLVGAGLAVAVATTWLALSSPLLGAGVVYALLFMALAWRHPSIALALVFAAAPFQNDLSGAGAVKFSIAEVNLALILPVFLVQTALARRRLVWGPMAVPTVLYFAVCLFSSAQNWDGSSALVSLAQMVLYLTVAVMVFANFAPRVEQLMPSLYGLVLVGVFLALMGIVTSSEYFLGLHKNGIGASLSCAVVVCLELWFAAKEPKRKRWLTLALGVLVVGLVWQLSRGAWISALTGFLVIVTLRRQFGLLWRAALVLVPVIAVCWSLLPQDSKQYATGFSADHQNIQARYDSLDLAEGYFLKSPVYGYGVGLRKDYDATNVVLMALAETGVLGLVTFLGVQAAVVRMVWATQRRVPVADPRFSLVAIGGALVIGHLVHGLVDHYWSRGALMICWAGVGMATAVYIQSSGPPRPARRRA